MCIKYLFLIYFSTLVFCETDAKRSSRKPKFLTFETTDGDVRVNLEFSVPFVTISPKNVMDSAFGIFSHGFPTVNINPGALALAGAVVIGTNVILPFLLKKHFARQSDNRMSRILDGAEFSSLSALDSVSAVLTDSSNIRGCILQISCFAGQQTSKDFDPVQAWNNIMSYSTLSLLFNSSTVEDAMLSGRNGRDCKTYTPCPMREDYIPILLNKFISLTNSVG